MMVGFLLVRSFEFKIQKMTHSLPFVDQYNYNTALQILIHSLHNARNKRELIKLSRENLEAIFKTDEVRFVFNTKEKALLKGGGPYLSVPILWKEKSIGVIFLGRKKPGGSYTKQDIQLVCTFCYVFAIALTRVHIHTCFKKYKIHLKNLIKERTAQIKSLHDYQKQSMLEISHSLQTPLAVIQTKVELLEEISPSSSEVVVVKQSIEQVSHFIRKMLHLARLETSLYPMQCICIDLSELLIDQIEYFQVVAEQEDVWIQSEIESGIKILGDKKLMEQLVINLVVNAIRYQKPGTPGRINISLTREGMQVVLRIRDTGIGIRQEDLPHIFKRFYRGEVDRSEIKGTGIGLAIVKEIIEKHKGAIEVESALGGGSCFTVIFTS